MWPTACCSVNLSFSCLCDPSILSSRSSRFFCISIRHSSFLIQDLSFFVCLVIYFCFVFVFVSSQFLFFLLCFIFLHLLPWYGAPPPACTREGTKLKRVSLICSTFSLFPPYSPLLSLCSPFRFAILFPFSLVLLPSRAIAEARDVPPRGLVSFPTCLSSRRDP